MGDKVAVRKQIRPGKGAVPGQGGNGNEIRRASCWSIDIHRNDGISAARGDMDEIRDCRCARADSRRCVKRGSEREAAKVTMLIQDALDDVDIAFRQLEFAIKLLSFCELGNIKPSDFDTDHIVFLGGET